ncbi:MAG: lytic transglycosylase domain-containing protein [Chitinophagaceae bacterium]|jgi:membrane-bound lytic murein transglycosylase D|nr:lytic transglycosylase domain-containing protein [Chitinophagaceae bacterium]
MRKKTFLPGNFNILTSKAPNLISISRVALLFALLLFFKADAVKGAPVYENRIKQTDIDTTGNSKQFVSLLSHETNMPAPAASDVTAKDTIASTANHNTVVNKKAAPVKVALNPHVSDFARDYLAKERVDLNRMKQWGQPYFNIFDRILTQYSIPVQLKYLAVIESSLSSTLRSHAGAVGPWQLMNYEAREYGLKMGKRDERTDYVKSTEVACKLLKSLYKRYDNWLLVIAAYNGGIGAVNKAIKKANSDDFWDIQEYLPKETRNHVKKFISTQYFFEGNGHFTTMTYDEIAAYKTKAAKQGGIDKNVNTDGTDVVQISGVYDIATICKVLNVEEKRFKELNPGFNKSLTNGLSYPMRLPIDKIQLFNTSKDKILEISFQKLIGNDGANTSRI